MSPRRRAALRRAIDNLAAAADDHAFLGTIPVDSDEALAARQELVDGLEAAKRRVERLVGRWLA